MNSKDKRKILIVSDREMFVEGAESVLKKTNFRIFKAHTFKEAVTIHRDEKISLIILEDTIHGMSNGKLSSAICEDRRLNTLPIIMVCTDTPSECKKTNKHEAKLYMTKPVNPGEFLKEVYRLLNVTKRKSLRVPANFSVSGDYMLKSFLSHAKNISLSGILLETDRALHQGRLVSFLFSLPDSGQIIAKGNVVRIEKNADDSFQYAITFRDLSSSSRSALEKFIKTSVS